MMTIVNVTLSIDLRMDDNEDVDDVAEAIASAASTMFPTLVMRVEHIDRDTPRTYGELYRAEGYRTEDEVADAHTYDEDCGECGGNLCELGPQDGLNETTSYTRNAGSCVGGDLP